METIMKFHSCKLFIAALAITTSTFRAVGGERTVLTKQPQCTLIQRGSLTAVLGTARSNYIISSFQYKGQIFLMGMRLVCQLSDTDVEWESSVPNNSSEELFQGEQNGEWRWTLLTRRKYLNVKRTLAAGDYPGLKVTYEFDVIRDFHSRRIFLNFSMPNNAYPFTGYMKNSVMQIRKVRKGEWFGLWKNNEFPYITFFGEKPVGLMILAADRQSWAQLPSMLLYSSGKTAYASTEFMYCQNKEMKKGMKGKFSFHVIPISGRDAMTEAAVIYAKLQKTIR